MPVTGKTAPKKNGFKFSTNDTVKDIKLSIVNHLQYTLGRDVHTATQRDWWISTSMAVRDRLVDKMIKTQG